MSSKGEGHGSNFFFSLPLYVSVDRSTSDDTVEGGLSVDNKPNTSDAGQLDSEKLETGTEIFSGLRILVVDDSTMVRKMLVKVLKSLGSIVDEASDGQEAINITSNKLGEDAKEPPGMPFDLILMDSVMPRVSGLEATKVIVKNLKFTNPVIGVTGNILPDDTSEFLANGAVAVLPKPLVIQDLADVFHQTQGNAKV